MENIKEEIERLAKAIDESAKMSFEGKEIAIAFSAGVDSTTLAVLAKKYAKKATLYTIGFPESQDVVKAIELENELDMEIKIYLIEEEEAKELYREVESKFSLGFLKSEILAPLEKLFRVVEEKSIAFGSGTEELFVGYDRYYAWRREGRGEKEINDLLKKEYRKLFDGGDIYFIKKMAEIHGKEALFPYCSKEVEEIAFSIPLEIRMKDEEKKKYILREAAKIIGTPEKAINRAKKALQYGSGIHKRLLKLKKKGKL